VDILLISKKLTATLIKKALFFHKLKPVTRDFVSIQLLYIFALCIYLFNQKSRKALEEATSSYLGNNLFFKIILIVCFYLITTFLVYLICYKTYIVIIRGKNLSLKYMPGLLFITFNFIPAFLQYFHDYAYINIYYRILQVSNKFPNFIDLRQTLGFITNEKISKIGDEGLIYPTIILKLRFLNRFFELDYSVLLIAFISTMLLAWVIFDISKNFSRLQIFILSIIVVSPPFLLLVDRQNIDLIILICLYFSAKVYNKNFVYKILSLLFIFISATLKIYPFAIFIYLFIYNSDKRTKLCISPLIILFLILVGPDLIDIYKFGVKDMAGTVGIPVLMSHFNGLIESHPSFSLAFFVFFLAQFLCTYLLLKPKNLLNQIGDSEKTLFFFGLVVFVVTMFFSTNYIYRLVFLIFFLPLLMGLRISPYLNISAWFLIFGLFLSPRSTGFLFNLYLFPFVTACILIIITNSKSRALK